MKDASALLQCNLVVGDSTPLQSQPSPPLRILVVDDDESIRQIHTEMLLRSGYAVDAAEDAAGWDALNDDSYDLMITDNNMPKVSGVGLLRKIRAARMILPVIMATGTSPMQEFARAPWLKPDATLIKPYTFDELLRTVKKVLREADGTADRSQSLMQRDARNEINLQGGEMAVAARPRPVHSLHRILVVDEDSDLRQLYSEALARPDYGIDVAEDGAAGWEALQANSYNLLITEHELPKLTGVELVRKLRAAHMALPVIMATVTLPTHELALNPPIQLAATLLKPFAVDVLLDTVQEVLRATDAPYEQTAPSPETQSQPPAVGFQF